jgi:hypothetical protein
VANNNLYPTQRAGITGDSQYIGGSSPYHIDLKLLQEIPIQERIKLLDSIAQRYAQEDRVIEFSNQGVADQRWNPNATNEEKVDLYTRAVAAHDPRIGYDSLDYYAPKTGETRYGSSAEGAPIYIATMPGSTTSSAVADDYGYFTEVFGPKGRKLVGIGHGDRRFPETSRSVPIAVQEFNPDTTAPDIAQTQPTRPEDQNAIPRGVPNAERPSEPLLAPEYKYTGPDPKEFEDRNKRLDQLAAKVMARMETQKSEEPRMNALASKNPGEIMALLAARQYKTPKSVI